MCFGFGFRKAFLKSQLTNPNVHSFQNITNNIAAAAATTTTRTRLHTRHHNNNNSNNVHTCHHRISTITTYKSIIQLYQPMLFGFVLEKRNNITDSQSTLHPPFIIDRET